MVASWEQNDPIVSSAAAQEPELASWERDDPVVSGQKIGFAEAFIERPMEKIPFSPVGAVRTLKIVESAKRLGSFDYPLTEEIAVRKYPRAYPASRKRIVENAAELYKQDVDRVTKHLDDLAEKERRGYTLMGRVGQITSEMPAFMTEFLATGGLQKLGTTTAKKYGKKLLGRYATTTAGKATLATGGFAIGTATRAAGMPHRASEAILRRQLPRDIEIIDAGVKITGPVEKPMTAIWKGLTDHYIEIASEQAGEVIAPMAGKLFAKLPFMGKLTGALRNQWLRLNPNKTAVDFMRKISTKAGYHGVVGEIGEEYLGDALRAITDVEHFGAGEDADMLGRLAAGVRQDTENLPAMAIAFSIPGAARAIPGMVTERAPAEVAPEVAEPIVKKPVVEEPAPAVEEPVVKRKPYKGQYAVGHKIPEILKMKTKERRDFMEETAGVRSMKEMTPSTAQDYIDALHQLAKEKGIDTITLPQGHKFKRPVFPMFTPQLYQAERLGIKFMLDPAIVGKQKLDLEFAKLAKITDKVEQQINKLGGETLATKVKAKIQDKPTKSVARFADLLNTHEEAPADLSKEEKAIFNYFRNLNRTIIQQENAIREELELEPITYKPGYMRHIVDTLALDIIEGRHPVPEEVKYWAEKNATKKIRNPMEFQRQLGDELADIFSNDIIKATKAMLWTGLKEINLDKPLKFFENQMGLHSENIPASTRQWAEKFINEMIVGQQTNVDQAINGWIVEGGIGKVVNKVLRPFGRRISPKPFSHMMMKAGRFQIYGVMGWRPKQLIRNKFQLTQNLALYTLRSNIQGFFPASKQLKSLLSESLFLKTYKGFEELREIDKRMLGRLWLAPFGWTAVSNARQAMKVAYWDTLELITDPKYRNLNWADPQRTYTEEREFLYPSEKEKILKEMEFGAGVTQYHYIPMAMPQAFRYKAAIPFTRLQSWWMNHFFKFHREAATRFFKGETAYGAKLPWSRRVGWGRYLVLGGVILNTLGYTSSFLFGAAPEGLPPLFQIIWNLYKLCVVWDERARRSAKRQLLYALKTFIPGYLAYKDVTAAWENQDDLTQLFFYKKGIFKEEEERGRKTIFD